jgi:hypothetical protein
MENLCPECGTDLAAPPYDEGEVERLCEENARLQKDRKALLSEIDAITQNHDKMAQEGKRLEERNHRLLAQNTRLRAQVSELELECERLLEALKIMRESTYQSHSGHWDSTQQYGAGCPECAPISRIVAIGIQRNNMAQVARSASGLAS